MATPVALTTVFTPAEFCSDVLYTQSTHYHGLTWYKQDALGPGDGSNSACYPPSLSSVWKVIDPSAVMYSPGVCPSGYVTVSPVNNGGHDEPATAICCPGYVYCCYQSIDMAQLSSCTATSLQHFLEDVKVPSILLRVPHLSIMRVKRSLP